VNVLSLFDGISCGQQAFDRLNIKVDNYFSSEIDKYAMSVTRYNYPNTKFIGSVTEVDTKDLPHINILIGGSPCQGFSFAGKRKGASTKCNIEITTLEQYLHLKEKNFKFDGQSYLFWEYIRILRDLQKINPNILFLLENVKMTKKWQSMFNKAVGIQPIEINSALVSAQNRKRLYWTNINGGDIKQPEDKKIFLKDIIENGYTERDKSLCVTTRVAGATAKRYINKNHHQMIIRDNISFSKKTLCHHVADVDMKGTDSIKRVYAISGKSPALTTMQGGHRQPKIIICKNAISNNNKSIRVGIIKNGSQGDSIHSVEEKEITLLAQSGNIVGNDNMLILQDYDWRKLTPLECERLQTINDNYTAKGLDENFKEVKISNSQRYKMIGNAWTVDVIVHIFRSFEFLVAGNK